MSVVDERENKKRECGEKVMREKELIDERECENRITQNTK